MTMATQAHDSQRFSEEVRQIRAGVPVVLAQWGLRSKFTRWRLTQDPSTGLVVLFGVLNYTDITEHTLTPFSDYFDPRLLLELAMGLNVQVVSSDSEGFRYAFILDRGRLPARKDLPALERSQLLVGITDAKKPTAEAWHKPIIVVDLSGYDQLNFERPDHYLALAGNQRALIGFQTTAAPLFKQFPTLSTPNRSLVTVVAAPTILAQVETEVARRKALYQPWPGNPNSQSQPSVDSLLKSRSELMLRIRLLLDEYDALVSPLGEPKRALAEGGHVARVGRKGGSRDRRADYQLGDRGRPPHRV
jgi:hypothetical protein